MKFSKDELFELTEVSGGRFSVSSTDEAFSFCKKIANSHYENFPVGSLLIPKKQRKHVFAVYAFARTADDIADEFVNEPRESRIKALTDFENLLTSGQTSNPIFLAVQKTIKENNLPDLPFRKLIEAFRRDVNFIHAESIEDLLVYCSYSANPIGEIVLRLFGLFNDRTSPLLDKICSALQLTNFWQDISIDREKGRLFIPKNILERNGLNENNLFESQNSEKLMLCLNELYDFTENLFEEGEELIKLLIPYRLMLEIKVTVSGGKKIMEKLRLNGINTINSRPKLLKYDVLRLFLNSFLS